MDDRLIAIHSADANCTHQRQISNVPLSFACASKFAHCYLSLNQTAEAFDTAASVSYEVKHYSLFFAHIQSRRVRNFSDNRVTHLHVHEI